MYGRIITEGLFGIRPTGFKSFMLTPRLPQNWKYMNLRHIHAFDSCFDIEVKRMEDGKLEVCVISKEKQKKYRIKDGAVLTIKL